MHIIFDIKFCHIQKMFNYLIRKFRIKNTKKNQRLLDKEKKRREKINDQKL